MARPVPGPDKVSQVPGKSGLAAGGGGVDGAGVLLAGALAWLVGDGRRFLEGELERAEAVAQGSGVVVAEGLGRGVEEPGEGLDQGAGLVQVLVLGEVLGQAEVDG